MSERESTPVERDPRARRRQGEGFPLGVILAALLLVYAVLFVVLNSDEVKINFVFLSTRISLVVAMALLLAIGFVAGYLVRGLRARTGRKSE